MALGIGLGASACRAPAAAPPHSTEARVPYETLRAQAPTRLTVHGPSTGAQTLPPLPAGAELITIQSGALALQGWLALPPDAAERGPVPGLVYSHGAFALKIADWAVVQPALDAGFAVLLPSLRGENGNPGHLELLAGEVDDTVAAAETLAAHPQVDGERIYALGHSVGGAIAALLSLRPDAPVRLTGSVGGIYVPQTFVRWRAMKVNRALVRFDVEDPNELRLRSLLDNVTDMVHPHHAYIGDEDRWFHDNAAAVSAAAARADVTHFVVHSVSGDHMSSLAPGVAAFVALASEDAAR
ncbi:MAG: alpha/beta fold hydrolase [Myxococcota bacterium]